MTKKSVSIRFYYPSSIVDKIFGAGEEIRIAHDNVMRNGVTHNKGELVKKVVAQLESNTPLHEEFTRLLLTPINSKL